MKKLVNGVEVEMTAEEVAAREAEEAAWANQPGPVPASITRRQLLIALAQMEIISGEEALAAAKTGAVPTAVQAVFDNMQPADKLAAEITWASMSVAERANPLVAALAQANGMTDAEIDDFFRLAASI